MSPHHLIVGIQLLVAKQEKFFFTVSSCLPVNQYLLKHKHETTASKERIHATETERFSLWTEEIVTSAQRMGGDWCSFTRRGAVSLLVLSPFSDCSDMDFSD